MTQCECCTRVFQIGVAFYEMLQAVDQHCQHLNYMDPICDFLYHIKYMYTGDSVKEQVRVTRYRDTSASGTINYRQVLEMFFPFRGMQN